MEKELTAEKIIALGYEHPRQLPDGRWIAMGRLLYTTGLFVGIDRVGYKTRFCYETAPDCFAALQLWNGKGDPPGPWIKEKGAGGDRINPLWARARS
jgi:hypothetical protein